MGGILKRNLKQLSTGPVTMYESPRELCINHLGRSPDPPRPTLVQEVDVKSTLGSLRRSDLKPVSGRLIPANHLPRSASEEDRRPRLVLAPFLALPAAYRRCAALLS
ncbi:unnamed protein product [Peniophora sp. CBMAI 1063]|nr:unnamed protein product [Peniophora sp. CBMAI 1063]